MQSPRICEFHKAERTGSQNLPHERGQQQTFTHLREGKECKTESEFWR